MTGDGDAVAPLATCERCGGTGRAIGRMWDSGRGRRPARIRAVMAVPCPACSTPPAIEPPADVDDA